MYVKFKLQFFSGRYRIMFAVIRTGGKQYRVQEGDILSVESLKTEKGQMISFDKVLLLEDGDQIQVGTPYLAKALIKAEVLESYKGEKVIVFKKKRRKGYRRKKGHRQLLARVRIAGIYPDGQAIEEEKPAAPPAARKPRKKPKPQAKEKLGAKPAAKRESRAVKKVVKKATGKKAKEK
jgi:large subunit ribosomal protein L21